MKLGLLRSCWAHSRVPNRFQICCGRSSCCRSFSWCGDDRVGETVMLSRRDYLKQLAAASAATWMAGEPRLITAAQGAEKTEQPRPTADACIVLWMAGGMAAPDNFDPKSYVPFEVGLPVEKVMSTFPAIDTAVDNIK